MMRGSDIISIEKVIEQFSTTGFLYSVKKNFAMGFQFSTPAAWQVVRVPIKIIFFVGSSLTECMSFKKVHY